MDMQNLRQRFGAFVVAAMVAGVMIGTASPAFAGAVTSDGTIGGSGKNACAFVQGLMLQIPDGVPGATIAVDALGTLATLWGC
jgi:hypothetical protein